jgi:hypothetical protein
MSNFFLFVSFIITIALHNLYSHKKGLATFRK